VVGEAGRGDDAIRLIDELRPDLAILDIKMPGKDGIAVAREVTAQRWSAVLILTAFSQREQVEQAVEAGALAYLVKPFQKSDLIPAIEVALGRFAELKALSDEVGTLGDQLATRKLVDRAKGLLMDQLSMSEQDAFRFIQRTAMSERSSMAAVAERVIDGGLRP
jgi:two-component system, response regulator PdtaR